MSTGRVESYVKDAVCNAKKMQKRVRGDLRYERLHQVRRVSNVGDSDPYMSPNSPWGNINRERTS